MSSLFVLCSIPCRAGRAPKAWPSDRCSPSRMHHSSKKAGEAHGSSCWRNPHSPGPAGRWVCCQPAMARLLSRPVALGLRKRLDESLSLPFDSPAGQGCFRHEKAPAALVATAYTDYSRCMRQDINQACHARTVRQYISTVPDGVYTRYCPRPSGRALLHDP
jgi:hypothetical protein